MAPDSLAFVFGAADEAEALGCWCVGVERGDWEGTLMFLAIYKCTPSMLVFKKLKKSEIMKRRDFMLKNKMIED